LVVKEVPALASGNGM